MTDQNKNTVWQAEHMPFGELFSLTGSITNNLRFPGQYYDEETSNHYNYFRDYNPVIGRYVEADPIGIEEGNNHLYVYARNNAVKFKDSLGLDTAGCDGIPDVFETPCRLECCAKHDECYDINKCNASSWYGKCSIACKICNVKVALCFKECKFTYKDDPDKPNYYCAKLHRYVMIPGDFENYKTAKKYCKSN